MTIVLKAANYAAWAHRNQRRKNPEATPYINHPIGVAYLIQSAGEHTETILAAALLHDTVEDTEVTIEDIVHEFGIQVAYVVSEVTDDKSLSKIQRKQLQVEHAPSKSSLAKTVKLADKLHNLRSHIENPIASWSEEERVGYFVWAWHVIKGMRGTNEILEHQLDEVMSQKIDINNEVKLADQLQQYYALIAGKE